MALTVNWPTRQPIFSKAPRCPFDPVLALGKSAKNPDPSRVTIVEGDILDIETLRAAMQGQDVVYANLAGAIEEQTKTIMKAIQATGLKRLVFINSMGIFCKVSGERLQGILDPYGIL